MICLICLYILLKPFLPVLMILFGRTMILQLSENIIYTTTNNGKGVITSTNIGGDADVGNTQDITDSENKLYGSLLIPKAVLRG